MIYEIAFKGNHVNAKWNIKRHRTQGVWFPSMHGVSVEEVLGSFFCWGVILAQAKNSLHTYAVGKTWNRNGSEVEEEVWVFYSSRKCIWPDFTFGVNLPPRQRRASLAFLPVLGAIKIIFIHFRFLFSKKWGDTSCMLACWLPGAWNVWAAK